MKGIELYYDISGTYPSMNCTVGKETIVQMEEVVSFFAPFCNRVTFSRMIGAYGITLEEYGGFLEYAKKHLHVRQSETFDCTMYGGLCGVGMDNVFYANGNVYMCGNCVDIGYYESAYIPLDQIKFALNSFDRRMCYKEVLV